MEVKRQDKNTEIGIIPDDWEVVQLQELASVKTGPFGSSLHEHDYVQDGTPIITVEHLGERGVVYCNLPMVSEADKNRLKGYSLDENDIVFSRVGSIDRNSLIRSAESGWLFSGRLLRIRPNKKRVLASYLSHYFNTEPFKQRVKNVAVGQTMPSLNTQILNHIHVIIPPFSEQCAIAVALSDMDNLLAAQEQFIAKKRGIKQAVIQDLITGKRRLPGFNEEWVVKSLEAVAEIRSGGTPSTVRSEFWDGNVLWCTPTDITALKGYKYLTQTSRTITSEGLKSSSAEIIPAYSVVMTSRATIGECAINAVPVTTNQGFKNFIPHESTDHEFLYYLLSTKKHELISLCGGSTFLEISKGQLASFTVKLPIDKVEQIAIAAVMSDIDTEIAALEQKQVKTRALKQGMMQVLLTGRVRLV